MAAGWMAPLDFFFKKHSSGLRVGEVVVAGVMAFVRVGGVREGRTRACLFGPYLGSAPERLLLLVVVVVGGCGGVRVV